MQVPTIKIEHPGGFCLINQSDFNPDIHVLFGEAVQEDPPTPKINLNTATQKELETLPMIGPSRAIAIAEARPFGSVQDAVTALPDIPWDKELLALVEV